MHRGIGESAASLSPTRYQPATRSLFISSHPSVTWLLVSQHVFSNLVVHFTFWSRAAPHTLMAADFLQRHTPPPPLPPSAANYHPPNAGSSNQSPWVRHLLLGAWSDASRFLTPPVTHSLIVAIIHPPFYPTRPSVRLTIILCLSSFASSPRQDLNDSPPLPTSCSTFYYPIEPDTVSAASSCPAGPQPPAGAASAGELPGPPAVETEWRPVRLKTPPLSTLPPVPAGGGPASRVTEELWKQHREVTRKGSVSSEEAEEVLNSRAADCSDLEMTLMWWLQTQPMSPSNVLDMCVFLSVLVCLDKKFQETKWVLSWMSSECKDLSCYMTGLCLLLDLWQLGCSFKKTKKIKTKQNKKPAVFL